MSKPIRPDEPTWLDRLRTDIGSFASTYGGHPATLKLAKILARHFLAEHAYAARPYGTCANSR